MQPENLVTPRQFVVKLERGENPLSEDQFAKVQNNAEYINELIQAIVEHEKRDILLRNFACLARPMRDVLEARIRNDACSSDSGGFNIVFFAGFLVPLFIACLGATYSVVGSLRLSEREHELQRGTFEASGLKEIAVGCASMLAGVISMISLAVWREKRGYRKRLVTLTRALTSPKANEVSTADQPGSRDSFPSSMLEGATMMIINYEGDRDGDLQRNIVNRLMPLAKSGCGFKTYCQATVPTLQTDEPACAMMEIDHGFPRTGVSLNTYIAYVASKNAFPAGHPREYPVDRIGYWVGGEKGKRVHAILLFGRENRSGLLSKPPTPAVITSAAPKAVDLVLPMPAPAAGPRPIWAIEKEIAETKSAMVELEREIQDNAPLAEAARIKLSAFDLGMKAAEVFKRQTPLMDTIRRGRGEKGYAAACIALAALWSEYADATRNRADAIEAEARLKAGDKSGKDIVPPVEAQELRQRAEALEARARALGGS